MVKANHALSNSAQDIIETTHDAELFKSRT